MLDVCDDSVSSAIDTGPTVLIIVETEHRVIKHIEGVHAEL